MAGVFVFLAAMARPAPGLIGLFTECGILDRLPDRPVVILDRGRTQGVELSDHAVLVAQGQIEGVGRVFYLEPNLCAVRLEEGLAGAEGTASAVVVSKGLSKTCRIALPFGTTIWATVDEIAPGHRTAWLSEGRLAGLLPGDSLLVDRDSAPIALGEVIEASEDQALIRLLALPDASLVRRGDRARLLPSPGERRAGQLCLPVLSVASDGDGQTVWLPGGAAQGLLLDRSVELIRGDTYLATAVIDQPGLAVTRAKILDVYARQPVQAGDSAVLGLPGAEGAGPRGRIFRIEGTYCLVSMGEDVGVQRRQVLHVVRDGRTIATLTVRTVKESYCGADIQRAIGPTTRTGEAKLALWDQVVADPPVSRSARLVGSVVEISPDGRFAAVGQLQAKGPPGVGTLVAISWQNQTIAAGLIVHRSISNMVLHIPMCWRRGQVPRGSAVLCEQVVAESQD